MKQSAGLLLYRMRNETEFFLVHPGGPFFSRKNEGYWTIPKGEIMPGENPLDTAIREFKEETGFAVAGPFIELQSITQKGGKKVVCWACKGDFDESQIISNTFEIEWPYRSGKLATFPEVDKAGMV
jgi:predicted NUDIX family NTP pyrophosphohydrolase